jgi:uncharacterized glyoxalase superfamily protein PhnB
MLDATSLSPGITVNDIQKSLTFYTDGLGFEVEERHEAEGVLRFVSLKSGAGSLGIGQDDFAKGKDRVKGTGLRIWISTKADIAALAARAKTAGITLDTEPAKLPWGPLAFTVTDPDGFKLTVANDE